MTAPRSRVMAVLTVLAMLGIGVAIGVASDRALMRRRWEGRGARGSGNPFGMIAGPVDTVARAETRARIVKRITADLTLSEPQVRAVDAMFRRRELQLDSIRLVLRPQMDAFRDQMRASMDSILTPEQRVKFAESRRRMDARRRANDSAASRR